MGRILPAVRQFGRSKWLPPLAIFVILTILGCVISLAIRELRLVTGQQIISRDAEVLAEVAAMDQSGPHSLESTERHEDDDSAQFALALRLSQLREGVLATRVFDRRGEFVAAIPAQVKVRRLSPQERDQMARLQPRSHYEPEARLSDYFLLASGGGSSDEARVPLLSVLIPIHAPGSTDLLAVAELIQDGKGIARELAMLDRHLLRQGALAFGLSGGIVTLALGWAFRRLQAANRKLLDHAAELRRANQELALAAKTSALGTVTAHVMHGLTSPLMGLQNFVASHANDNQEWQDALHGTQRMQSLIGEFLRVLGEETNGLSYELPLSELAEIIADRTRSAAQSTGVQFTLDLSTNAILSNRDANLVMLILENLLRNAVQATPSGKTVCLRITTSPEGVVCEVHDEGPGLPAAVRDNLFTPCRSTKNGGNGIGLALSQQLARHLGAQLSLVRSGPTGSVFALQLPSGSKVNGRENNATASLPHPTARN